MHYELLMFIICYRGNWKKEEEQYQQQKEKKTVQERTIPILVINRIAI